MPRSRVVELTEAPSNRVYPIFIKTPKSYHKELNRRFPVIYLTDGSYSFQLASGATRYPMNIGVMEEAIIVAISYEKGSRGASSRIRDYTPSKTASWKLETGNAAGHASFIREAVFPYIEQHYRTSPINRTYVGNSLGGLFGAYLLFNQPQMFTSYILGSPSVWFNDHAILSSTVRKSDMTVNVYLAVGSLERPEFGESQDMVAGAKKLAEKIKSQLGRNVKLKFKVIDDATHATAFPTTLIQGLDWIHHSKK